MAGFVKRVGDNSANHGFGLSFIRPRTAVTCRDVRGGTPLPDDHVRRASSVPGAAGAAQLAAPPRFGQHARSDNLAFGQV
jgi:hypothetical protein